MLNDLGIKAVTNQWSLTCAIMLCETAHWYDFINFIIQLNLWDKKSSN